MKTLHCSDESKIARGCLVYSGSLDTVWRSPPGIRTFQILIELKCVNKAEAEQQQLNCDSGSGTTGKTFEPFWCFYT